VALAGQTAGRDRVVLEFFVSFFSRKKEKTEKKKDLTQKELQMFSAQVAVPSFPMKQLMSENRSLVSAKRHQGFMPCSKKPGNENPAEAQNTYK
jgi:hypothetical protein